MDLYGNVLQDIVKSASTHGLRGIVTTLSSVTNTQVSVFDIAGNALAVYPERAIIEFSSALEAMQSPNSSDISCDRIEYNGETVAYLASGSKIEPGIKEIAIATTSLELARLRAGVEGRRELIGQLFEDVIEHRAHELDAQNRFNSFGMDISGTFNVIVRTTLDSAKHDFIDDINLQAAISGTDEHIIRFRRNEELVFITEESPILPRLLAQLNLQDSFGRPVTSIGVSRPHSGIAGLRAAYYEAQSASREGPGVHRPSHASPSRILLTMSSRTDLTTIAEDYLEPLLGSRQDGTENHLLETLKIYLETGSSGIKTSEQLFIHRNTLRYRLAQIEALMGVSLESTEDLVNMWLALQMRSSVTSTEGSQL